MTVNFCIFYHKLIKYTFFVVIDVIFLFYLD